MCCIAVEIAVVRSVPEAVFRVRQHNMVLACCQEQLQEIHILRTYIHTYIAIYIYI